MELGNVESGSRDLGGGAESAAEWRWRPGAQQRGGERGGVVVAVGLRRQMLIGDALPFPGGIAAGETIKEMYSKGDEAMQRVRMLLLGGFVGPTVRPRVASSKSSQNSKSA